MDIQNKVAVVTGAARGIGRATALALAGAGARAVVIADQREELAEETAALVRAAGAEALAWKTDVADLGSLRALLLETANRFGALDILHNNAGLGEGDQDWPAVASERVGLIVDVNLRGTILGTQLALPLMQRGGGGVIINTASGAAFTPLAPQAVYAATKAGIVHFTKSCAELAVSHGVRVACICPGLTTTEMVQESGPDGPHAWLQGVIDAVEMLTPEDIAAGVLELVRDPDSAGRILEVTNQARK
ncbi:MAG: SDR family NAD(P)-dependent oxidoreductase [Deltaproteobacteria bacterium]